MNASIPCAAARVGELLEQARPDPLALVVVGDRERGLGRVRVAQANVVADRDDPLLAGVPHHADQGALLGPVRLDERAHEPLACEGEAVEAEKAAPEREVGEEVDERGDVAVGRGPQAERRAVTEDDVDSHVGMVHQFGHPGLRSPNADAPASGRAAERGAGNPQRYTISRSEPDKLHPGLHRRTNGASGRCH